MHYVCSDIHGQYDSFLAMLQQISFSKNDELYVLGDVIDRGPKPIDLLLHILGEPNMHMLLGNHEHMMIRAARNNEANIWIANGCRTTINQLKRLSDESVEHLIRALEKQPLVIPDLTVGEHGFYLTHAGMPDRILGGRLYLADAGEEEISEALWSRKFATGMHPGDTVAPDVYEKYRDSIILYGHTPVKACPFFRRTTDGDSTISPNFGGTVINLDCGCADGERLAFLRLEDMAEFYVNCSTR